MNYVSALRKCGNAKLLAEGKRIHSEIIRNGLDTDTFIGNLLVQMYGNCNVLEDARAAFYRILQPNVFSYNIMLAAYTQNDRLQDAKEIFERMPQHDVVSWTTILAAHAQNGHVRDARGIFDAMPSRNIVSWNAMVAAYAHNGYVKAALLLFRRMNLEGMHPNKVTFFTILDACASISALTEGKEIHASIIDSGFETDVLVATSLVNIYGKCRKLKEARSIFDNMPERNAVSYNALIAAYAQNEHLAAARELFDSMPEPNVVSWNAMISAYAQNGYLQDAKLMFDATPEQNTITWTVMISAYAQAGDWQGAQSVFDKASKPSVVLWNGVIGACALNGHCKAALRLFRLMDLEGMKPSEVSFVNILYACTGLEALEEGKAIHARVVENGLDHNVIVTTALLSMYGKCGNLEEARDVFDKVFQHDPVSWNAMIAAYTQNGHGKQGIQLFRGMNLEGVMPDEVTFMSVITACSHAGLLDDGRSYFIGITTDYHKEPSFDQYVCMIDLLGRAGQLHKAESLVETMPFQPDYVSWSTLLGGCKIHGNVQVGARAAKNAIALDPDTTAPYIMLFNMYAATGNHDEAARIRKAMEDRGVKHNALLMGGIQPTVHQPFVQLRNQHLVKMH